MTEQLALNLSDMVKDTLNGRDTDTMEGFPEEVTSGTSREEDTRDQCSRKSEVRVGHSRNGRGSSKAQAKNMILLCVFYFRAETFYLFFYFTHVTIAH